jgi:hypothetical protein
MRVDIKKNTDQLNYEDFLGGVTRTVTIAKVEKGRKEAQYDIAIEGDDRYWRPPATVLKLLVLAYGDEAANWVGKSVALYGDPDVKMKGVKVGGIRVSHLSHIDQPLTASLTVTRGQTGTFTVLPLEGAPTPEPLTEAMIACATDKAQLAEMWKAHPDQRAAIEARVAELDAEPAGDDQ